MANKIIKYNLNADGTIPTYIADGGYFPKANSNATPYFVLVKSPKSEALPVLAISIKSMILDSPGFLPPANNPREPTSGQKPPIL